MPVFDDPVAVASTLIRLNGMARTDGLLSLEGELPSLRTLFLQIGDFMSEGLRLMIDGQSKDVVREILETRRSTDMTAYQRVVQVICIGIAAIGESQNPRTLLERLAVYLPVEDRCSFELALTGDSTVEFKNPTASVAACLVMLADKARHHGLQSLEYEAASVVAWMPGTGELLELGLHVAIDGLPAEVIRQILETRGATDAESLDTLMRMTAAGVLVVRDGIPPGLLIAQLAGFMPPTDRARFVTAAEPPA